ncbi:hypothetical protein IRZ71_08485 [Flavobacterium sp. ANB]|uniref:hypothetical protein n=1 Tax=unclassified Flavobacterium TaxID=196869 RepID=UPI0012B91605|nr:MULTISPECIES: hypothetical protein [unclassified Flavobacterium]MBF4516377.1 hypothetical protein [Flavobacterium sp. ANB]MTD69726.1 hypothetical protein [Flavobacterium sp. LC2016-13]
MKNIIYCFLFLLVTFCNYAQDAPLLRTGIINDSVKVVNAPNESYAIYFPKEYDAQIPSAVVFIFDPDARAKIAIEPFILAAETYNYILVCSNNVKNGLVQNNVATANRLFDHVLGMYNINMSQLYISGFSGGARLASFYGISSGFFQGVIACGASFNDLDKFIPPSNKFSYVGMVGDKDMNYQEMVANKTWLDNAKITNTLFISHEDHIWPKQNEMLRAFDWLEIQAYKKNIRPKNDTIIKRIYDNNLKIADSLRLNKEMISSVRNYENCITSFNINDDSFIRTKIAEIKKSREYKEEVARMDEITVLEGEILDKLSLKFYKELELAKSSNNFKFWKTEFKNLDTMKLSKEVSTQNMANRILVWFHILVYEAAEENKRTQQKDKVTYCDELLKMISETNPK